LTAGNTAQRLSEHTVTAPAVGAVDVTFAQQRTHQIGELIEARQRLISRPAIETRLRTV